MEKNVIEILADEVGNKQAYFVCPGCNSGHAPYIEGKGVPVWRFNNDLVKPTLSPSILVRWTYVPKNPMLDANGKHVLDSNKMIKGAKNMICHSFVRNGMIEFLNDCTHRLKGKTVKLNEI